MPDEPCPHDVVLRNYDPDTSADADGWHCVICRVQLVLATP